MFTTYLCNEGVILGTRKNIGHVEVLRMMASCVKLGMRTGNPRWGFTMETPNCDLVFMVENAYVPDHA